MASICKFFDEDAVYKINKKKFSNVGLVLENSEYLSSDEENSDDPEYRDWGERMKRGHIRVAWHPNGVEEVLSEKKVRLCDRSLMPGDVVRRLGVRGHDMQLGYCRHTQVTADVQVMGTKHVLQGVSSTLLQPLDTFVTDVGVFKDSWVGMVKSVKTEITLRCTDGSRCLMSDIDAFDMDDVLDKRERASEFKKYNFYPGQHLWGPTFCFSKVKWLQLNKALADVINAPNKTVKAVVEDVKVVSLGVQWVCRAFSQEDCKGHEAEQPKYHVSGEDLKAVKLMNILEPCTLQIGDRNFLVMCDHFSVCSLSEWRSRMGGKLASSSQGVEKSSNEEGGSSDDGTSSSVSSRSTGSSVDKNLPSTEKKKHSPPHYATKMKRKRKQKSVRRRAMRHTLREAAPLQAGEKLVTEALVTETRAHVVWQDGSMEKDILSTTLFPVHHLDGHEFFPGDYVVDTKGSFAPHEYGVVQRVDHSGRTALVTWLRTYHTGANPHPETFCEEEVSVYDIRDHPDFKYRPGAVVIKVVDSEDGAAAGQVVDVHPSGRVEVAWVGGGAPTSLCYPQELYRVSEYDSDDLWADDDDPSDEDSWETESENSLLGFEDGAPEKELVEASLELEQLHVGGEEEETEKLLANIEKLRAGMARLEEVFTQNPTLQTCNVMRRLLELYKHCKVLDQLLGTTYFHERHLQTLVERLRQRGRVNSIQHVADHISRLFSTSSREASLPPPSSKPLSPLGSGRELPKSASSPSKEEEREGGACRALLLPSSPSSEPRNLCQQLCAILKSRLLKAHEDAELRFGMPRSETNAALLAAEEKEPVPLMVENDQEVSRDEVKPSPSCGVTPVMGDPAAELSCAAAQPEDLEEMAGSERSTDGIGLFSVMESVADTHKYKLSIFQPLEPGAFFRTVRKEMNLLKTSLPKGVIVKSFEDRIDLFSVLVAGPCRTPYEGGLFLFDVQLPGDYPRSPPLCHYVSYCADRLNPNLYEGGKVCVSLLGTWGGKGTEMWNPNTSNLLQVIVSIQGLILVSEPYYNEAGYERQKGTQLGMENSRMYNEMVVLKLVQSVCKMLVSRPKVFQQEIAEHFQSQGPKLIERLESWLEISKTWNMAHPTSPTSPTTFKEMHSQGVDHLLPEFPLIPASKGFCLTLRKLLPQLRDALHPSPPPASRPSP